MPVSSSGLVAGKNFPVHPRDLEDETHRRKMVRGTNQAAAAAFTPETQLATMGAPIDTPAGGGAEEDLGLELSVTPFIPARAHIIFIGTVFIVVGGGVVLRLYEGATLMQSVTVVGGVDDSLSVTLQALRDLQPDTTYTYTAAVVALSGGAGAGDTRIESGGTLTVRIEARRLGI